MSRVKIQREGWNRDDPWQVWIGLPDQDPTKGPFGFIIGVGDTEQAAIADAIKDLQAVVNDLADRLAPTVDPRRI